MSQLANNVVSLVNRIRPNNAKSDNAIAREVVQRELQGFTSMQVAKAVEHSAKLIRQGKAAHFAASTAVKTARAIAAPNWPPSVA